MNSATFDPKHDPSTKTEGEDPATAAFLDLLENDIATRPDAAMDIPESLMERLQSLIHGVEVDLEAPLEGEVSL